MPLWGPITVTVGPGSQTPDTRQATIYDSGTIPLGSLTQVTGTVSVSFAGGRSDAFWFVYADTHDAGNVLIENVQLVAFRLTTSAASWSYTVPFGAAHVRIYFQGALYAGQTMTCVANGDTSTATYCVHGTHGKGGSPAVVILTQANILGWLTLFGANQIITLFSNLVGLAVDVTGLCASPPGQIPAINSASLTWSPDEALQALHVIMWFNLCECVPGSPAPVAYPQPPLTISSDFPAAPTFPCDPADLCSSIAAIRQQLAAIATTVSSAYQLTTLQQRYTLPFAYISGARHSALIGQGGFATSRLLGLRVEITGRPETTLSLRGNPPYLFDMGWLAVVDSNGLIEEKRLTRDDLLWFPRLMPQASRFQWDLFDGVQIAVTELQAEP